MCERCKVQTMAYNIFSYCDTILPKITSETRLHLKNLMIAIDLYYYVQSKAVPLDIE